MTLTERVPDFAFRHPRLWFVIRPALLAPSKVCGSSGRVNATFWRDNRILANIILQRTTEVISAYV
jgi:hypothetical protein